MKKFLQSILKSSIAILFVLGAASNSSAQLTEGDIAPNFTYNDINGVSHTLYDYLDDGYSVFITMSATWCGPCWSFHQSGAKSSLWTNHGPAGEPGVSEDTTDDLVVIFIEGDPQTTTNQLNGNGGGTQGNWVAGTNYPIIDLPNSQLVNQYGLTGFPNAWLVCPDRRIRRYYAGFNQSTMTAAAIYEENGACAAAEGDVNPALIAYTGNTAVGCEGGELDVIVTLQNMGMNELTSATLQASANGNVLLTQDWTGSLNTYAFTDVNMGSLMVNESMDLEIVITSTDEFPDNAILNQTLSTAAEVGVEIELHFYTDFYPSESSWQIRNSANQTVATGGPYQAGTQDQWGGGGPDANTIKVHSVTLPSADDCYSIRVMDSFGDGLQYGENPSGQFGLEVFYNEVSVVNLNLGDFGNMINNPEVMKTLILSAQNESRLTGLSLFPNPTSGMLNIEFDLLQAQNTQIDIFDIAGKRVMAKALGNLGEGYHMNSIDMSGLQPGLYIVNFITNKGTEARKVLLSK